MHFKMSQCFPLLIVHSHSFLPVFPSVNMSPIRSYHHASLHHCPNTGAEQRLVCLFASCFILYLFNSSCTQPPGIFLTRRFNHVTPWCKSTQWLTITIEEIPSFWIWCAWPFMSYCSQSEVMLQQSWTANPFSFIYHVVFQFYALVHAVPAA